MGSQLLHCAAAHGITVLLILLAHALPPSHAQRDDDTPASVDDPYADMKFNPSLAIIIVVLASALFLMVFFSVYVRNCVDSTNLSAVLPTGANRSGPGGIQQGLDQEVIDTFPTFVYSEVKTLKIGKSALECAVCLNEFEDDETLRLIPKCDHVFHPECIDAWLESHTTCPVCRSNLALDESAAPSQPSELLSQLDLEAQNDAVASAGVSQETTQPRPQGSSQPPEPPVISVNFTDPALNKNRTRGSRSGRPHKFPRSHSTGHSLVQPGEDTERFTLRLPVDVRKQIMSRELNRSNSLLVLPRGASSRRGGEGSSRGRNGRLVDRSFLSERWVFSKAPPFFQRASSLKSSKVADEANWSSVKPASSSGESSRPPG